MIHKFLSTAEFPLYTIGIDEAGRGPWAGPVVAAAVFLNGHTYPGLNDSKVLSEKVRNRLYDEITQYSEYGIGESSHEEIDLMGIRKATHLAMQRALEALKCKKEFLLIDGRDKFYFEIPNKYVIRGDSLYEPIAAASIIAKVTRDRIMEENARMFPGYSFELHKGYGTKKHQDALLRLGVCTIHRRTYRPVKAHMELSS